MFLYPSQTNAARTTPATQPAGPSQPAVLQTSVEPTPQVRHGPGCCLLGGGGQQGDGGAPAVPTWAGGGLLDLSLSPLFQAVAAAAQAGLLQQQAELERKAAELEKKERELQSNAASINREWGHDEGLPGCSLGGVCPFQRCCPLPGVCRALSVLPSRSEAEQLATPAQEVPHQALLLPGFLRRHPGRLPADMQDALLPVDA